LAKLPQSSPSKTGLQTRCQFHQHFTSSFFISFTYSFVCNFFCQNHICAKAFHKRLVKLATDGIVIQELKAFVPLQNLLDHSAKQILLTDLPLVDKIKFLASTNGEELNITFFFKFGLDGCGSFNTFMQKGENGRIPEGSTLLTSQMVPLQAVAVIGPDKFLLHNSRMPNNANSCRPIRLCFEKETKDTIKLEAERLKAEVDRLVPFILMEEPKVSVTYRGLFTMIDGKVLNELTQNPASSCCPICHKTSRQMSNPEGDFTPKPGTLEYGASILHFGIRAFEAICHIGYGQDVKKFGVRLTLDEKAKKVAREKLVKAEFQQKLGLIVDQSRDGGAGNTTTGNVARKALANSGK